MWMQTRTGLKFNLDNIDVNNINIEDIAHALSMQCRFNGHTPTGTTTFSKISFGRNLRF
jgi:hypothetical protein